MNKVYVFLIALFAFFMAGSVFATVGGPTYISEIGFSATESAVYYKVNDNGGRGCPPIIHKIDLGTGKDSEVKSCDQYESEYATNEAGFQKYTQFLHDFYQTVSYLGSVSLKKNNINVQVKFVKEGLMEGFDEPVWRDFEAQVFQDGREIGKINFRGCAKDQPHVFEGYMIPNSNQMLFLISNKGDCFEGGYVRESLHLMRGVTYHDTNIVRSFKEESATEPNSGNVVVYATTEATSELPKPTDELAPEPLVDRINNKIPYAILAIIALFGLGYGFRRAAKK